MTNSTKTKHTTMYVVTGPTTATKILALRRAAVPSAPTADIDISSFDDDYDQFVSGRRASGEETFDVVYDATDHAALETLYNSGSTTQFMIIAPASDTTAGTAPTVTGSAFAAYTSLDNVKFSGYIKDRKISMDDNNVWMGQFTIKLSGQSTVTAGP